MTQKRIEGLAKVTGAKIFARDFRPRDFEWPVEHWHVLLLRARYCDRPLASVDPAAFPEVFRPVKIVQAADLAATKIKSIKQGALFKFGKWWLVEAGQIPEYTGQVIAILYFETPDARRRASAWLRAGNNAAVYGEPLGNHPEDDIRRLLDPLLAEVQKAADYPYGATHYVRIAGDLDSDPDKFSFAVPRIGADGREYKSHDPTRLSKVLESKEDQRQRNLDARRAIDEIELAVGENGWKTLDRTFYTQSTDPVFLEPETGLGWWEEETKSLHIVYGTQSPNKDTQNIREIFSGTDEPLKNPQVRYQACYPGGGFGGRDESSFPLFLAIAAVFAPVPVRLAFDRFEQFLAGIKCHAAVVQNRLAYRNDGAPQALLSTVLLDGGGELNLTLAVAGLAALQAAGVYRIPRTAISSVGYHTNGTPAGSLRGFGIPPVTFAIESMIDEIATSLAADPIDFRLRHAMQKGNRDVMGCPLNHNLANVEICREALGQPLWAKRQAAKAARDRTGLAYGVGFAVCMESFGTSRDAIFVEIGFDSEGRITIWSCGVDMGQGTATSLSRSAENFFGLQASRVLMGVSERFEALGLHNNPDPAAADQKHYTPKIVTAQSASVTAFYHLHAAEEACKVLMDHGLRPVAEKIWNDSAEEARWENGFLKMDGKADLSFSELAARAHSESFVVSAMIHTYFQVRFATAEFPIDGAGQPRSIDALGVRRGGGGNLEFIERNQVTYPTKEDSVYQRSLYASVGHIIAVEVHTGSGQIDVVDAVTILDAGDVHHPELLAGQAEGGFAMGISHTLFEELPPAPVGTDGSWNLHRYQMARAGQVPLGRMRLVTLPLSEASILADGTRARKKGIAEAVLSTVSPAIHNAVAHAVGVRINSLPMSADRVLEALLQK